MVPNSFRPDWLLATPPRNPYLVKSEYFFKPNFLDNVIHKIYNYAFGRESEEFKRYITRDQGLDIARAQLSTKMMQQQIRQKGNMNLVDESVKKALSDK